METRKVMATDFETDFSTDSDSEKAMVIGWGFETDSPIYSQTD